MTPTRTQATIEAPALRAIITPYDRLRGLLLGGAVGEAVGASIGLMNRVTMDRRFGEGGPTHLLSDGFKLAPNASHTQLMLFTLEAVIRTQIQGRLTGHADFHRNLQEAYGRWIVTQVGAPSWRDLDGWLVRQAPLWRRRGVDHAALNALSAHFNPCAPSPPGLSTKSVTAVTRAGLVGLLFDRPFAVAGRAATFTQDHLSGVIAAGWFASWIDNIVRIGRVGSFPITFAHNPLGRSAEFERHADAALDEISRARSDIAPSSLGLGYLPEEAAVIAGWSVITSTSPSDAFRRAVYVSGPSNGVACLTGQALGAELGAEWITPRLTEQLAVRDVIERIVDDAAEVFWGGLSQSELLRRYWHRYPTVGALAH